MLPKRLSEFAFDPNGEVEAASTVDDDFASLPGDLDPSDLRNISDDEDGGIELWFLLITLNVPGLAQ